MAQLGQPLEHAYKLWGRPVAEQLNDNGSGILQFSADTASIKMEVVNFQAYRLSYTKPKISPNDIERLLEQNSEAMQWDIWTPPGRPAPASGATQWMRSDEMAMARLNQHTLTITGTLPTQLAVAPDPLPEAKTETPAKIITKQKAPAPPNASKPENLPAIGSSKEDVFQLIGKPSGNMIADTKEILVYAWGYVWLSDGKVSAIK
jgi:hypothetical protein